MIWTWPSERWDFGAPSRLQLPDEYSGVQCLFTVIIGQPSLACLWGEDSTSSRLFQPVCERGSFVLKPPYKRWNLTCKTPVAAPEQRLRWLTGGPNPCSPPSSSSSSSSSSIPKLSWKAGASWIRLGLFCPNWRHRWDNDFYKQHSDERRGKGAVCKMHKGLHKHIGLCIWNKLKRCLII